MKKYLKKDIEKECENFTSSKGKTAFYDNLEYKVEGTFLDSNGCMKSYGIDKEGHSQESFIIDTIYK
jgi:hypothetical protein